MTSLSILPQYCNLGFTKFLRSSICTEVNIQYSIISNWFIFNFLYNSTKFYKLPAYSLLASRSFEQELIKCLHFEFEECPRDVLELALEYLPPKIRLELNASLVLQICSDVLLQDADTDADGLKLTSIVLYSSYH